MIPVRLFMNIEGSDGWARIIRDVHLPALVGNMHLDGIFGQSRHEEGDAILEFHHDLNTGETAAWMGTDSNMKRTLDEMLADDDFVLWTVEERCNRTPIESTRG